MIAFFHLSRYRCSADRLCVHPCHTAMPKFDDNLSRKIFRQQLDVIFNPVRQFHSSSPQSLHSPFPTHQFPPVFYELCIYSFKLEYSHFMHEEVLLTNMNDSISVLTDRLNKMIYSNLCLRMK
jgi:hypothetical protein